MPHLAGASMSPILQIMNEEEEFQYPRINRRYDPAQVTGPILLQPDAEAVKKHKYSSMLDAMELARQIVRLPDDDDPDPYGYVQDIERDLGLDLLEPRWKAKPDDNLFIKRAKARARKMAVMKLFMSGFNPKEIADKVKVSEATVVGDIQMIQAEFRREYLNDAEALAAKDLARTEYWLSRLAPGIDRGDTKSIGVAVEILKERASILGYRTGVQVDITQYIVEVAQANGFDPEKAIQIAERVAGQLKG